MHGYTIYFEKAKHPLAKAPRQTTIVALLTNSQNKTLLFYFKHNVIILIVNKLHNRPRQKLKTWALFPTLIAVF